MMGADKAKFKVGDSVRYSDDYCCGVGTIHAENSYDDWYVKVEERHKKHCPFDGGTTRIFDNRNLEPVPQFAVGDRVRLKRGYDEGRPIGSIGIIEECEACYCRVKFKPPFDGWGDDNLCWHVHYPDIEPAVAAPLRIEAGKFYKTRDGRKVGPMRRDSGCFTWPWCAENYEDFCRDDGTVHYGDGAASKSDLISEWPDEPTYNANPAAEVDTLRDEYGAGVAKTERKFKVGDRVAFVDDYGSSARGTEATVVSVDGWGIMVDGVYGKSTEAPSSLRLVAPATSGKEMTLGDILAAALATPKKPAIVALIENGQPLPSHRPFVHPDSEAALKEAKRLAGKHVGQTFGVYELVDTAKEAKVYDFDWQRLAIAGRKIEAIKELRAQVGLTLTGAKKSVEHWLELNAA